MTSITKLVEDSVLEQVFLEEALAKGIINYAALANLLQPEIASTLNKEVKSSAIMMALRRYAEKHQKDANKSFQITLEYSDITVRSDLIEFTIRRSPASVKNLRSLYDIVDLDQGDFLTITSGIYEITIISNSRYKDKILSIFDKETHLNLIENLSALSIKVPPEALDSVGIFYTITKVMAWNSISIVEIVSTFTELTLILREEAIHLAFKALKQFIGKPGSGIPL